MLFVLRNSGGDKYEGEEGGDLELLVLRRFRYLIRFREKESLVLEKQCWCVVEFVR